MASPAFSASQELPEGKRYYDAISLVEIGYDALCIGNHDFDFGPGTLARIINDFSKTMPPYLSANLDFTAEDTLQTLVNGGRIAPRTIIEKMVVALA